MMSLNEISDPAAVYDYISTLKEEPEDL